MRKFLISLSILFGLTTGASACGYDEDLSAYYMFSYCDNSFRDNYEQKMAQFWKDYCGEDCWLSPSSLLKYANKKNDTAMKIYLQQLEKYQEISDAVRNSWEYPTAMELAKRKQTLRAIANVCQANLQTKYGSHWALLYMRTNMLLNDHQANIVFYTTKAKAYPNDCFKDMMKNIYARDLLLTGKKQQAWNIYAEQNDQQSLLWSVRKYTNLAGIKNICASDPNAPVLNFLVQTYVNRIQSLVEEDESGFAVVDYSNVIWGKAYAQVGSDNRSEFAGFVSFAKQMAKGGKTNVPCMWMSAAALVNYFMHDNQQAKACIDAAVNMKGTEAMKDNARRIRMLIEPTVANIKSDNFKSFMAQEMRWLDNKVKRNEMNGYTYSEEWNARHRIIKKGLAAEYARVNDKNMAFALLALSDLNRDAAYEKNQNDCFDYSSMSFSELDKRSASEIEAYFKSIKNPGSDPLMQYIAESLNKKYSDNYVNDVIGTKLLAENKLSEAIPYLKKVSQNYLNNQAIGYYVAHRDYKTPAWLGYKSIDANMYDDNGNLIKYPLNGNVKVKFCQDVIELLNQYSVANYDTRKEIAYKLATYYYQASYKGQCWYITHYGQSVADEQNPKEANFPEIAINYLSDAAKTNNQLLKSKAFFGLVGTAPDLWAEQKYDDNYHPIMVVNEYSQQYSFLRQLDNHLSTVSATPEYISNCDVLLSFRKYRK